MSGSISISLRIVNLDEVVRYVASQAMDKHKQIGDYFVGETDVYPEDPSDTIKRVCREVGKMIKVEAFPERGTEWEHKTITCIIKRA